MKLLFWIIGVPVACLVAFLALGFAMKASETPAERAAADKAAAQECATAVMSNMGTSTRNYRDKQAYDAHVADKCSGFKR
jgi:hypothetical protein